MMRTCRRANGHKHIKTVESKVLSIYTAVLDGDGGGEGGGLKLGLPMNVVDKCICVSTVQQVQTLHLKLSNFYLKFRILVKSADAVNVPPAAGGGRNSIIVECARPSHTARL
jgi:hypothetical protein